jgi:hypothetical protein
MKKILFILKERSYGPQKSSYGLMNSAVHVANYLQYKGYDCKVSTVVDGNGIDKEVYNYEPDIVVIEALWCPVYKLQELIELPRYKDIKWVIRVHSDIGFLSCETQALQLINGYMDLHKPNLVISLNSEKFVQALSTVMNYNFTYLPNIITTINPQDDWTEPRQHMDVGCFGAMRLLKNQCYQAMCAILAADELGKILRFHITPFIAEQLLDEYGEPVQAQEPISNNLIELFKNNRHELIVHEWLPNDEFQDLIKQMDIGLQISYTESFNIVTADFINNNKLIVVSDAIDWLSSIMRTSTTDYENAVSKIIYMYKHRNSEWLKSMARHDLQEYNRNAKKEWDYFLKDKKGHRR